MEKVNKHVYLILFLIVKFMFIMIWWDYIAELVHKDIPYRIMEKIALRIEDLKKFLLD